MLLAYGPCCLSTCRSKACRSVCQPGPAGLPAGLPPKLTNLVVDRDSVAAVQFCNTQLVQPYQMSGYNVYDMRKLCGANPLCYDFTAIEKYLNSAEVKSKLGVTKTWTSCNMKVNAAMQGDWMRAYAATIPPMLQDNIPVLIYAGKLTAQAASLRSNTTDTRRAAPFPVFVVLYTVAGDQGKSSARRASSLCAASVLPSACGGAVLFVFYCCRSVVLTCLRYCGGCCGCCGCSDYICNHLGNKAWTLDLEWPGKTTFNDAADLPWMVDGRQAGRARSHAGFTFLQVFQGKLAPKECSPRRYAAQLTPVLNPAGHMVPMDQPGAALAMFNSFLATGNV